MWIDWDTGFSLLLWKTHKKRLFSFAESVTHWSMYNTSRACRRLLCTMKCCVHYSHNWMYSVTLRVCIEQCTIFLNRIFIYIKPFIAWSSDHSLYICSLALLNMFVHREIFTIHDMVHEDCLNWFWELTQLLPRTLRTPRTSSFPLCWCRLEFQVLLFLSSYLP